MPKVDEVGPDLYRISVFMPEIELEFNHFVVKDDEPVLFHTGLNLMFDEVREGVAQVLDPAELRWIGFSHFESDECGSLNRWLDLAPHAQPACSSLGAMVCVNDFATRPARGLEDGETLETGRYRFQLVRTPHLPHGWDPAVLYEQTQGTLLCSDLFHQIGAVEPLTTADVVGRTRQALKAYQAGPLADYSPYTPYTAKLFDKLAALEPRRLAIMHGSSFEGDGGQALRDLGAAFEEVFGAGR